MKGMPEGIGLKGLFKLILLSFKIWKRFGFKTLWRKISYKLNFHEELHYPAWINQNEPSEKDLSSQKVLAKNFSYRPLISIVMPVFNPAPTVLQEAIESVLGQTYEEWDICIADGSDPVSHSDVKDLLKEYARKDPRIHVLFLNKNGGISKNSNKALEIAEGEFIALLDHDDRLAPFAFYRVVEALNRNPDLDLIYSDRDLLSETGKERYHPFFKPDWSPETLVSVNYLIHLCVIRKSLVDKVGRFNPETDGAQDWDLFFRVTELTTKISHIPEILYHWRVSANSAAWSVNAKPYLINAQVKAIGNHFQRIYKKIEVSFGSSGFIKINWNEKNKKASIIITAGKSWKNLNKTLKSVTARTAYPNYEILILLEHPEDRAELVSFKNPYNGHALRLIAEKDLFASDELKDRAVQKDEAELFIFMDSGLELLDEGWLTEMAGWLSQKEIGVVGGKILYPDGTIRTDGMIINNRNDEHPFFGSKEYFGTYGSSEWYGNYQAVSGSFMAVRQEVFKEIEKIQSKEDQIFDCQEFCSKVRENGYRVVYSPYAVIKMM
jgi:O-antigen biosynthesis protein